MALHLAVVRGGNVHTKVTENFLLSQPDVIDASVWMNEGQLMAHVTLAEGSRWTASSLRTTCAKELGLEYTPSEVVLFGARMRVA